MKIAFIITVYKNDKLDYFREAIESIVNQDYGFEKINIYLGLDGELASDIQNYIDNNSKLFYKIVQNDNNKGLAFTLNRLINILEDEVYIFRMDSDDICRVDRVTKTLDYFQSDNELMIVGSDMLEIDEKGKELRHKIMPSSMDDIINYSIARNPFNHPTVAVKKEFFDFVGKYDEALLKSQDYELWVRALKKGVKGTNINEPLLSFRISDDFMQKRNSLVNSINEFKISFKLMIYFGRYLQFPKILIKLIIRFLPQRLGQKVYKKIRSKTTN